MGFASEEDGDRETGQQMYYAMLAFHERYPDFSPLIHQSLLKSGPPPPEAADGYWGKYRYLEFRAMKGDREAVARFERLKAERPSDDSTQ